MKTTLTTLFLAASLTGSHAAFVLVDDFESYAADSDIGGQGGWTSGNATWDVESIDGSNQLLVGGNDVNNRVAYKGVGGGGVADGNIGTLYFELYSTNLSAGASFGLADAAIDPTSSGAFNSFRAQLALTGGGDFQVNDGGTNTTLDQALAINTAYQFWMVVDNDANTYTAYIQGGAFTTQTQLTHSTGATSTFTFRNSESEAADLTNFLAARGGGGSANVVSVDNIWFDANGANLNAVPEPSSTALLGLAGLGLLVRRKRA